MNSPALEIGAYALNQPISDHPTVQKKSFLGNLFESRKKKGETLYNAGKVDSVCGSWNLVLGVANNQIRRLSAQWATNDKVQMEARVFQLIQYWQAQFGCEMTGNKEHAAVWQNSSGSVTVDIISVRSNGRETGLYQVTFEITANPNK